MIVLYKWRTLAFRILISCNNVHRVIFHPAPSMKVECAFFYSFFTGSDLLRLFASSECSFQFIHSYIFIFCMCLSWPNLYKSWDFHVKTDTVNCMFLCIKVCALNRSFCMLSSTLHVKTRLPDPTLPAAGRPSFRVLLFIYLAKFYRYNIYTCSRILDA